MRQINLIPHAVIDVEDIHIHPFWKYYFFAMIAAVVGSILFGYVITFQIGSYQNQLKQTQSQAASLAGGVEQFQSLVDEQTALTEELEDFQERIDLDTVGWFGEHPAMTEVLYHIVQSMPDTIWLTELTCNFEQHEVVMRGVSVHKNQVFQFAQNRLEQDPVFQAIDITNITEDTTNKRVLFSITATMQSRD